MLCFVPVCSPERMEVGMMMMMRDEWWWYVEHCARAHRAFYTSRERDFDVVTAWCCTRWRAFVSLSLA